LNFVTVGQNLVEFAQALLLRRLVCEMTPCLTKLSTLIMAAAGSTTWKKTTHHGHGTFSLVIVSAWAVQCHNPEVHPDISSMFRIRMMSP
jgi:uncharacterized membrane protein